MSTALSQKAIAKCCCSDLQLEERVWLWAYDYMREKILTGSVRLPAIINAAEKLYIRNEHDVVASAGLPYNLACKLFRSHRSDQKRLRSSVAGCPLAGRSNLIWLKRVFQSPLSCECQIASVFNGNMASFTAFCKTFNNDAHLHKYFTPHEDSVALKQTV